jgi:hypothetical protein
MQRRAAEQSLLAIGAEFRSALISYASATPPGFSFTPTSIQDLLRDPRYPNFIRRHLRKLYVDPLTSQQEWGMIKSIDGGGIIGFYSLSTAKPIKVDHFELAFEKFKGAVSYRDWVFQQ